MKKYKKKNKKKKIIIVIIIIVLLILISISSIVLFNKYKEKHKLEVILKDKLEVEINSEVELLSFVKEVKNGQVVSKDEKIDTSSLGKKKLTIKIIKDKKQEEYSFNINVIDTTKPVIEAKEEVTINTYDEIDLKSLAKVSDNSNEDISVELLGDYDTKKAGEYHLKYVAKDTSNNEAVYDFILKVVNDPNKFVTSKGFMGKIIDGVTYIDGTLIVNKTYKLPSSYGNGLTSDTKNAFNQMQKDASKQGLNLYISSGYRSYSLQQSIYNNYVASDGQKNADTYSARAGHSEHQTGLAFDLNTIDDSFDNTKEAKWVHNNCYKYGLILRFPKGKDNITGYMYESWHLRYVGTNLATKLYNDGNWLTLEEYYGIDSKYR